MIRDPFDRAVLVNAAASTVFGGLIVTVLRLDLVHAIVGLWPVFLALSAIAWLMIDTWSPREAPPRRQLVALAAFVGLEALAVAPLVALGWELAGSTPILGAAMATAMTFAALAVFALLKPTTYLEPIDPLIVVGLLAAIVLLVGLGLGLPLGLVWATTFIGVTAVLALDQIAKEAVHARAGEVTASATRLFACVSVLFAEFVYYFAAMVRPEGLLWQSFALLFESAG